MPPTHVRRNVASPRRRATPGREAVIVAARRTPIGRALKGSLAAVRPEDLVVQVVEAALAAVPLLDPEEIEDLILGCGLPFGEQGANVARRVAIQLGLDRLPAMTINRFCASSLQSTRIATHAIKAGEGDVFISAGVESVSRTPDPGSGGPGPPAHMHPDFGPAWTRTAKIAERNVPWTDPRADGLLPDAYISMGQTAENIATSRRISRRRQDEYAVLSQQRAERAIAAGFFDQEITPLRLPGGKEVTVDDGPRPGTTYEAVARLKPAFRVDGTVTAGNACPLNDGAAALIVMSEERAAELGIEPLARIVSTGVSALSPEIMGLGPVDASKRALAAAGMTIDEMDVVEINEAFAVQVIAAAEDLEVDPERVNVHGGAIALGHPFGMTGARITATLINALRTGGGRFGLETMCVAGGQGMAMVIEALHPSP